MDTAQWIGGAAVCLAGLTAGACLAGMRWRPGTPAVPPTLAQLPVGLLLWADIAALLLLTAGSFHLGAAGTAALSLAAGLAAWLAPVSILPEDADILGSIQLGQRRWLRICFFADLTVLLILGAWLGWLFRRGASRMDAVFAVIFFLLSVAGCHVVCLRTRERFEILVDKQYQQELLSFMQIIRSQRHDFSLHMNTVAGMIEREEFERCREYVQRMVRHAAALNEVLPLADPAVSALLNTFSAIAAEKHVRLELQLRDPLQSPACTAYELNTIIGNLLQNALDETEHHGEDRRWIKLLLIKWGRKYAIKVSNPCDTPPEELERIFDTGFTTKQSHEGIGLVTVKRIAKKCGGSVSLEYEPGIIHMVVHLPVLQPGAKTR